MTKQGYDAIHQISQLQQDKMLYGTSFFHTEKGRLNPEKITMEKRCSPNPDNAPQNPGYAIGLGSDNK